MKIKVKDKDIYYESKGEGKPLLLIHGLGSSLNQMKDLNLSLSTYKQIFVDVLGHGKSDYLDNYSFDSLAKYLLSFMSELGYKKFSVGGISMGAAISLKMAILAPERIESLMILRPAWLNYPMEKENNELFKTLAYYLKNKDSEGFVNSEIYKAYSIKCNNLSTSFISFFNDEASLNSYQKFIDLVDDAPFGDEKELNVLNMPVLIESTKGDPLHPYEYGIKYHKLIKSSIYLEIVSKYTDTQLHFKQTKESIEKFIISLAY